SDDGYLSGAVFCKEISSFVTNTSQREELDGTPGNGDSNDYTVSIPINGESKVTGNGIEAGFQYAFDFLPQPFNGFGALINGTYQDADGYKNQNPITLEWLPFPGLSQTS